MSAIYFLDMKGKTLIARNYRGDVGTDVIDKFLPLLLEKEEEGALSPVLRYNDQVNFLWTKFSNLYIVAATRQNPNAAMIFAFLHKIISVLGEYFKELEEESIRDNFVLVYELLDELMDFGYPQTTDTKILQEYITQEGQKMESAAPRPPMAVTNAGTICCSL